MRSTRTRDQARQVPTRSVADAKALVVIVLFTFGLPSFEPSLALAQQTSIVPTTGTGDLGTTVTPRGHTFQITGGARPGNGTNLFHSFDQFNLGRGDTAQFLNTTPSLPTLNILSRVTGGNSSNIFGTIQTSGFGDANLFLMNPAGIVFGPNVSLDVGGSVTFTTANYLRHEASNGSSTGFFHADPSATSLLSSAPVSAFGFLSNPVSIVVEKSILEVRPAKSLSLIGGDITIQSSTLGNKADPLPSAPGKQVLIASVGSPGEILAGTLDKAPNIDGRTFEAFGTVQVSEQSAIDTRGVNGGKISIKGGQLVVDSSIIGSNTGDISLDANSILLKNGARLITFTTAPQDAGDITLIASNNIELDSSAIVQSLSQGALGNAGNITLISSQGNINLIGQASTTSQTRDGSGNSGSIGIDAQSGDVRLDNSTIFTSAAGGTGTIGGIRIRANNLDLLHGARIDGDNFSKQVAGNIDILVKGLLRLTGSSEIETTTTGTAPAADLLIQTGNISITDGSRLSANTNTATSGAGGHIVIEGVEGPSALVVIDGLQSGIFADTEGTGAGGAINLSTKALALQNGGTISASTTGADPRATGGAIIINAIDQATLTNGTSITASTSGPANAGNILLKANEIAVNGGSSITASSTGSGNAGTVTIQGLQSTAHSFLVDGGNSGVFTKTSNTGTGGNLSISSNSILIQNNGTISGETTGVGSGGNITLTADESVTIKNGATISSSSTGSGPAGNVEIHAGKQFDVERGSITTQSNQLNGGNITILASDLVRVVDGKISTSALNGGGNGGNITIDPKVVLLQSSEILAQAKDGNGGSISIATPLYLKDQSSLVSADSEFGVNGTVTIQSPISNVSGTVGQLVSKTSPLQVLLQNRCIALAGGEQSTLLLAGRDALPVEPNGWLSSPVSMEHWTGEDTAHASRLMARNQNVDSSLVIAAHSNKSRVLSLRRLTPPGFLVRTFATEATGCPS